MSDMRAPYTCCNSTAAKQYAPLQSSMAAHVYHSTLLRGSIAIVQGKVTHTTLLFELPLSVNQLQP
jgi:hypothetical protein